MTSYVRFFLLAFCLYQSQVFSQGFGTIVGTVTDPTGAVVAGAKVKVTDEATAAVRETNTNEQGYFVVPSLRPATYAVAMEAPGFASMVHTHVVVQADESRVLN